MSSISVLLYAVLCWAISLNVEDKNRLKNIIKKVGSVVGIGLYLVDIIMDMLFN